MLRGSRRLATRCGASGACERTILLWRKRQGYDSFGDRWAERPGVGRGGMSQRRLQYVPTLSCQWNDGKQLENTWYPPCHMKSATCINRKDTQSFFVFTVYSPGEVLVLFSLCDNRCVGRNKHPAFVADISRSAFFFAEPEHFIFLGFRHGTVGNPHVLSMAQ